MRGATFKTSGKQNLITISIHAPHAGRDSTEQNEPEQVDISIHAPHAGRDSKLFLDSLRVSVISIHAPHAGRDGAWI